ncbi:MAG TPA: hypothetical protein VF324_10995 [Methanobacterium sp.]
MRQDIKGKIFVGMIISIVAFGFATGTGFLIGTNPLSSVGVMNLTKQGEFPSITTTPNNEVTSNDQVTNNTTTTTTTSTPTQTNPIKKQNTTTSTNTNKNSSSTSTKTNKTSNVSG